VGDIDNNKIMGISPTKSCKRNGSSMEKVLSWKNSKNKQY